jgi:hypothetical protein
VKRVRLCRRALLAVFVCAALLHHLIVPFAFEAYNDECYLPVEERAELIQLIKGICEAWNEAHIPYWIDFGTLLGAIRAKTVLPHDHDCDFSYLVCDDVSEKRMLPRCSASHYHVPMSRQAQQALRQARVKLPGFEGNAMVASYRGKTCDFFRYKATKAGLLRHHHPGQGSLDVLISPGLTQNLAGGDQIIPASLGLETGTIDFEGTKCRVPRNASRLLQLRYPFTSLERSVPYKWRCYCSGSTIALLYAIAALLLYSLRE